MKCTKKVTLSLPMREFLLYATPKTINKKELHHIIRRELNQCIEGIINGDNGGSAVSWKGELYRNMFEEGVIMQTSKCKEIFGDFSNND